jgi:putative Holliday junction resolvase
VGLALSDPTRTIASPLDSIPAEPADTLADRIAKVALEHEASRVVVGLPKRMDGSSGPEAAAARVLADAIRRATRLPVTMVDERLSSRSAERVLLEGGVSRARRRQLSDRVAAVIILQSYLDSEAARRAR